jgi:hypothetical protein
MGRAEQHKTRGAGWVHLHVVIDDHSRYLYAEQHPRETPKPTPAVSNAPSSTSASSGSRRRAR